MNKVFWPESADNKAHADAVTVVQFPPLDETKRMDTATSLKNVGECVPPCLAPRKCDAGR